MLRLVVHDKIRCVLLYLEHIKRNSGSVIVCDAIYLLLLLPQSFSQAPIAQQAREALLILVETSVRLRHPPTQSDWYEFPSHTSSRVMSAVCATASQQCNGRRATRLLGEGWPHLAHGPVNPCGDFDVLKELN